MKCSKASQQMQHLANKSIDTSPQILATFLLHSRVTLMKHPQFWTYTASYRGVARVPSQM